MIVSMIVSMKIVALGAHIEPDIIYRETAHFSGKIHQTLHVEVILLNKAVVYHYSVYLSHYLGLVLVKPLP